MLAPLHSAFDVKAYLIAKRIVLVHTPSVTQSRYIPDCRCCVCIFMLRASEPLSVVEVVDKTVPLMLYNFAEISFLVPLTTKSTPCAFALFMVTVISPDCVLSSLTLPIAVGAGVENICSSPYVVPCSVVT